MSELFYQSFKNAQWHPVQKDFDSAVFMLAISRYSKLNPLMQVVNQDPSRRSFQFLSLELNEFNLFLVI